MDCPHGIPLDQMCDRCESELDELEAMSYDDYDRMPFGDAMRYEDEACWRDRDAGEGQESMEGQEGMDDGMCCEDDDA